MSKVPTIDRPKTAENSEKGRLARPVRTLNDEVLSLLDFKRHCLDKDIAVRAHDRDLVESDICGIDDLAPAS